ncbi:hypothetical protein, partial [Periweissella ghanensis]
VIKKPVPVEVWQIPFEPDMNCFLQTLPKEVRVKVAIDYFSGNPMLEGHIKKMSIISLEGEMDAKVGDYIVQGDHDDVWVVQREIFEDTYDIVEC